MALCQSPFMPRSLLHLQLCERRLQSTTERWERALSFLYCSFPTSPSLRRGQGLRAWLRGPPSERGHIQGRAHPTRWCHHSLDLGGEKRERDLSGNKVTCLKISFWHQLLTRRILEGAGERERVHQPLAERGRGRRAGGSTRGAEHRCLARALIPR